jgi:hypothetical protein
MARRMINSAYCSSGAFTTMSYGAQSLYIQLMLEADDEGFNSNPMKTAYGIKLGEEELEELESKSFIIRFPSECCVIKHWWCHNYISPTKVRPTEWQEELALLTKKDNGAYTLVGKKSEESRTKVGQSSDKVRQKVGQKSVQCSVVESSVEECKVISIKNIAQNDFERGGVQGEQNEEIDPFSKNIDTNDRVNDTSEHLTKNDLFEMFWKDYPRKVGKDKCLSWFKAHKVDDDLLADMLNAIAIQKTSEQWNKDGKKFIPHPYTWLNRGGWKDEVDMVVDYSESKPTEIKMSKKVEQEEVDESKILEILENISKGKLNDKNI